MALSPSLADWLRAQGHDVVHAAALNLHRASDIEIIARAREEHRTIVTADLDYPCLLALSGSEYPSLILFRDGAWSDAEAVARFAEVLRSLPETDIARSIVVVERDRLRRRRLPIGPRAESDTPKR
jgi:predicted nuclease of predicted toxin-antitoxin system